MLRVLLFLILYVNRVINGHPAPSPLLCHGFQTGVSYIYKYDTSIQLNNEVSFIGYFLNHTCNL
jgi:hypothetical protein